MARLTSEAPRENTTCVLSDCRLERVTLNCRSAFGLREIGGRTTQLVWRHVTNSFGDRKVLAHDSWALYSLFFHPQFKSFKLLLGHSLQRHRCGQIQSGNVFHFAAVCYLATYFVYFWVSAHSQKHFIRIGDGKGFFNQAMLNQNAMIRRYCRCRRMSPRSGLVLFSMFHLHLC